MTAGPRRYDIAGAGAAHRSSSVRLRSGDAHSPAHGSRVATAVQLSCMLTEPVHAQDRGAGLLAAREEHTRRPRHLLLTNTRRAAAAITADLVLPGTAPFVTVARCWTHE